MGVELKIKEKLELIKNSVYQEINSLKSKLTDEESSENEGKSPISDNSISRFRPTKHQKAHRKQQKASSERKYILP